MKTFILIDLSSIFWANWHATADRELSAAFELTVGKVHQLAGDRELCAVCCDAPPYARRKALLPTYKANREAAPPAAIEQLKRVKARLEADGLLLWEVPGFESDDIIATACAFARREEEPLMVTIATSDKDLAQLVDDTARVQWLSTIDGQRRGNKEVAEKFGVPPQLMRDFLALIGDKSDNVPGVAGVGPVNAAKLLERFGDLEGVLAGASQITQPKLKENLIAGAEAARLASKVIELATDVPIDFDAIFAERAPKPLVTPPTAAELDDDAEFEDPSVAADPLLDDVMGPAVPAAPVVTSDLPPLTHEAPPAGALAKAPPRREKVALALPLASFDMTLQPGSFSQLAAISGGIYNSRLYTKFSSPEAITAVVLRGREMGILMMTSLDVFHVVEGKPTLHAHLIIDRAKKHPDCEYFRFVRGDDTFAEWASKSRHNPEPTTLRYTIEQAKRAGLCPESPRARPVKNERGKDIRGNWEKRPDEMLRKMAGVQLARIDFPGAALGLYAIEEIDPDHEAVGAAA